VPSVGLTEWQAGILPHEANALLLDEPTSGLDPKAANEFSELLKKLSGNNAAILMATHDLFRAKETGTRVGIRKRLGTPILNEFTSNICTIRENR
jgi:ABC-2 type transport system ATP-binding protein